MGGRELTPYYQADGITIYHADCRDVLPTLATGSVDLVLTDPPYGHNNNNGDLIHRWEAALGLPTVSAASRPIANDGAEANDLVRWLFQEANRLLKPGCCCCCCCCGGGGPDPQFARWSLWLDEAMGFKHAVVWDKGGLGMGWHYRRNYELMLIGQKSGAACHWFGGDSEANVVRFRKIIPQAEDHPTPKPIDLMAYFTRMHSTDGDLVVDPFVGGGSSAIAARLLGRRFLGCDIEERWLELAANRLRQAVLPMDIAPVPAQLTLEEQEATP